MNKEKPPVLTMAQINAIQLEKSKRGNGETVTGWCKIVAQAQYDALVAYYEPLIQQAREEVFGKIEGTYGLNRYDDKGKPFLWKIQDISASDWQALKSKHPRG